jgi:uncharacterized protein
MAAPTSFHVLTKPIGAICNLDCSYCFYLEKERLYPGNHSWRMSDEVLESYIRQYIAAQETPEIHFAWQGGEPTLLGVGFFRKVIELQRKYAAGKTIFNALQTNGTLLDDDWCAFLAEHGFLVGLSIDGPAALHDRYRVDKQQKPTFDAVMRGLEFLKRHGVQFNTLTVVSRANSQHALAVYRFLKQIGSEFLQFIPLVERKGDAKGFAEPPDESSPHPDPRSPVTEWSVGPRQYGLFLCEIFDEWVRRDVGRIFVQLFDVALENWVGVGSSLCVFAEKCGKALAVEHNGDLFSCDHYVYPKYHLGNLMQQELGAMVQSPAQVSFGDAKLTTLPAFCRNCEVRFACNGECPKHRFCKTPDGEDGLNYLCPAYKLFFNHIDRPMRVMADLLRQGRAPAEVMGAKW